MLPKPIRDFANVALAKATAAYVNMTWRQNLAKGIRHELPSPLIVTLTSYPPRYPTLHLTLKSLLAQSVRPDRFCLWIARSDFASLPLNVHELEQDGLEILQCSDMKSYKKIIPSLEADQHNFFVTADDDRYYARDWLRELVDAHPIGEKQVTCGRAHRIAVDADGMPLPYLDWKIDVTDEGASKLVFPTGLGGVLYEPGIFHSDVTKSEIFLELCPTADDIWLYWMASLNGARFRKIGPKRRQITWVDSQRVALYAQNRTANDEQLAKMIDRYGFPAAATDDISNSI